MTFLSQPAIGRGTTENLIFHHLTDADGLSQRTVHTILQDSEGYMWFGTQDGLNKYDGYDITVYRQNPADSHSISYNDIHQIFEDSRKNLWVATGGGLNRYDRDKDRFIHYDSNYIPEIPDEWGIQSTIYAITEGSDGILWIGTNNGIVLLDDKTRKHSHIGRSTDEAAGLNNRYVTTLLTDSQGNIWIGTRDGLNLKPVGKDTLIHFFADDGNPESISDSHIQAIFEDAGGTIWIGTLTGGLNYYHPETGSFTSYMYDRSNPYSINDNSVSTVFEDSRGTLWIGSENEGLNYFDRELQLFYQYRSIDANPFGLNTNAIYSIYESNDNKLWIGTYNGGLNILDRKEPPFEHYRHHPFSPHSLSINSVHTFLEDSNGNIWVGTDGGGLNLFNRQTKEFTVYRHDPDDEQTIPGDVILDLVEDKNGHIWMATYRNGFSSYDPESGTFRHYRHDPSDPETPNHAAIFSLYFDPLEPNHLWVGTNGGGTYRYDIRDDSYVHYRQEQNNPNSLNQNDVRDIFRDSQSTLYIGNYSGFLIEFEDETEIFHQRYFIEEFFFTNVIQMIYESRDGELWLATWGGGLKKFDRETGESESYTEREGLPNNNVHGILEDDYGNLWVSSNNGISMLDIETGKFQNYGIEDNLQSREFNPRAAMRDSDGYMYFGGVNGFNRFHPDSLDISRHVAPIVLTDFKIYNEPVLIDEKDSPLSKHISRTNDLTLSYKSSVLTFEYASINFDASKNIQYAYKMEGFDENWNFVGNRRSASYTNLGPGEYRFRVMVVENNEMLEGQEASVALTITPPFWRTNWFYLISGIFFVGFAGGFYRFRVYNISKQNIILEKEVTTRTKDLKHALEELQSTRDQLVDKAHRAGMADMATNVLHDVGNILNSVNTSATLISGITHNSEILKLKKANDLLRNNINNLDEFINKNPKGPALMDYYLKMEEPILKESEQLQVQSRRLTEKIELIIDVVSAQQNFSSALRIREYVSVEEVINNTLVLQQGGFLNHDITIKKEFQDVEEIELEKSKLVHILINILENAKQAVKANKEDRDRAIIIRTWQDDAWVFISITDSGIGFPKKNRSKIFTHGFTTKKEGHGFGLHSCANYIQEMDGVIEAESDGAGKGATFIIQLPRKVEAVTE